MTDQEFLDSFRSRFPHGAFAVELNSEEGQYTAWWGNPVYVLGLLTVATGEVQGTLRTVEPADEVCCEVKSFGQYL